MLKKLFILPIRFYQKYISPAKPPCCRFTPTCSQYAIEAILEWGVIVGLCLAVFRILRCNPFGKGGYDPVPVNKRRRRRLEKRRKRKEEREKKRRQEQNTRAVEQTEGLETAAEKKNIAAEMAESHVPEEKISEGENSG